LKMPIAFRRVLMKQNGLVCGLAVFFLLTSWSCKAFSSLSDEEIPPTKSFELSETPEITPNVEVQNEDPGEAGNWFEASITPMVGFAGHFQPITQIGGNSYALAVDGRYAYLGVGPRILVVDMESGGEYRIIGQSGVLPGVVRAAALKPPFLFLAVGKGGLRVLDISDPSAPVEVGALEDMQWTMSVVIDGDRLYLADNALGLAIVDISNPAKPMLLGTTNLKNPAAALAVQGDVVFIVHMSGGLVSIDVSKPEEPSVIGELPLPQMSAGITLMDHYALIAGGFEGLLVIDIAEPGNMKQVSVQKTTLADGIAQSEGRVYLTDSVSGLLVFDLSDPAQPRQIGTIPMTLFSQQVPGQRQVIAADQRVFLANPNQGFVVVDVSGVGGSPSAQPSAEMLITSFDAPLSGSAFDSVSQGSLAYVTRDFIGLGKVDISNESTPANIASESSFIHGAPVRTSWKFEIQGRHAFMTDVNLGFRVLDLETMQEIGGISEPRSWSSLVLEKGIAFAATIEHDVKDGDPDAKRSLRAIDITSPPQPRQVGLLKMDNNARALALMGNILFYPDFLEMKQAAEGEKSALHLIDVSDPSNLVQISEVDTTDRCSSVGSILVVGSLVYLGDMQKGICIIDVSDPADPILVGQWNEINTVFDMALSGERIFAACYSHVAALSIKDPLAPMIEDVTVTPGLAWGIDANGERVFVADMDGGLNILRFR
jgi:hypothetical protein